MTRLRVLLAVVPLTAVLAACSSSTGAGDSAAGGADGADRSFAESELAPAESPAGGKGSDGAGTQDRASGSGAPTVRASAPPQLDRAVISNGTVSLVADDVAAARREVQRIVDGVRGQVSEENTESDDDGETVYARLVLRVPAPEFDETMTALEGVAELRTSQRSAEDVTTQVIDTEARLRAQQASLERVEALLGRADRLQQIVWIESQLTQRQAELDSLRQQQTWLADQTSLSTITVDVERTPEEKKEKTKKEDEEAGFLAGLDSGLGALAAAARVLATVTGALLPFAVLLAVLGLPVWVVLRRRRPGSLPAAATGQE